MKRLVGLVLACTLIILTWVAMGSERARLPAQLVPADATSSGQLIQVRAGGDFQAALDSAMPGDTIELEAGAVFRGPFVAPRKFGSAVGAIPVKPDAWITVRPGPSQGSVELPPPGVRVAPKDAPAMARLEVSSGIVLSAAPGAHHYRFIGIEFSSFKLPVDDAVGDAADEPADHTGNQQLHGMVWLGTQAPTVAAIPHHFIFERCYLHGDPETGARRGMILNSAHTAVLDSYFADFKMSGEDSQAIVGWAGPGPYRIQNNYLEAAGENVMFGGADPTIAGLVPADIEIRGNHFTRPKAWRVDSPGYTGTRWSIKNLLELKNARRVLVDGNLFEHHWSESQSGFAILFTVRNQQGTAPWSVVEDVTFSNNIVRHVASGINMLGQDNNHPSQPTRRITIRNNLFEDVGGEWGSGDLLQLLDGTEAVTIEHNTALHSGRILIAEGRAHQDFAFRNNIVQQNEYGMVGSDVAPGRATLERYFAAAEVHGNLIIGGAEDEYPAGNEFPSSKKAAGLSKRGLMDRGLLQLAQGDFRLQPSSEMSAGADFVELCAALSVTERPDYCATAAQAAP